MSNKKKNQRPDSLNEGREDNFLDVDRMVNEGLGGGNVTRENGLIEATTTDTMKNVATNEDNS
jgi:hypothetical protein